MPQTSAAPITAGRSRTGWTLVLASVGAFVTSLDVVVVATALPTLRTHLGANLSDLDTSQAGTAGAGLPGA